MDFQSAMETFAEAWVAANIKPEINQNGPQSEALELTTRERTGSPETPSSPRAPVQPTAPSSPPPFDDKTPSGRSLPVHCVVETVWSVEHLGRSCGQRRPALEVDSYVIIPVNTTLQDLVSVALHRLGYSKDNAAAAKGSVVIKNWKPLSFEKIAESPLMTVGDILGELSTIATLRIQIFRSRPNALSDMKDKLLRLLLVQSHSMLLSSGCPLDENVVSQLIRTSSIGPNGSGQPSLEQPSEETRRKFDQWWAVQQARLVRPPISWYSSPPPQVHDRKPLMDKPQENHVHPALQTVQNQYPTPKTRMRTSFDPELELPKLQRWFMENQHPSRQQIQQYVRELNSLESRRGRKPLDVNNVVYWFKNARAAQKRAEVRSVTPGMHCHLLLNGYNSNSQSPSDTGMMTKSPASTNQDDDDEIEPHSPAPLSLTTNRSPSPRNKESPSPAENTQGEENKDDPEGHRASSEAISDSQNNNTSSKEEQHEVSEEEEEEMDEVMSEVEDNKEDKIEVKTEGGAGGGETPRPGFPIVPNSMFSHSIMYMSHYFPGLTPPPSHHHAQMNLSALADERRKRNRTFIDPVSEVPRLEQWFALNTHPSHNLILKYTDDLNRMPYRQKFPPLEPKNVQFWFKNRRAKCKRLKMSLFDTPSNAIQQPPYHHHLSAALSGDHYQAH
ncbi:uncharacterized protein LOC106665101 isoform X2 [Cimex lectularius]|uniref:Defective proventriculus n=1 Tax=Cimex lectularius TaxID=79782 RepID=A0A8I6TKW2_CIMLE|nr:uncharacterized protein LOC106665101 isoform X2 [Cimex lectularius]